MADVTITLTFPGTTAVPVTWGDGTVEFIEEPQVADEPSVVIPPVFGAGVAGTDLVQDATGVVIPLEFGTASIVLQDPSVDPPDPDLPPPDPGGSDVTIDPDDLGGAETSSVVRALDVSVVGGGPAARQLANLPDPEPEPDPDPDPEPDPDPDPDPEPGGDVLWTADAELSLPNEWASMNDPNLNRGQGTVTTGVVLPTSRISRDTAIKAQGAASYYVRVDADDRDYYGPTSIRTELGMANPEKPGLPRRAVRGDDLWYAWWMRLDSNFPVNSTVWQVVRQFKQFGSGGSPVLALEVRNGQWQMHRTSNDINNQTPSGFVTTFSLGAALVSTWCRWVWHVHYDPEPDVGYVEIFGDLGSGAVRTLKAKTFQSTQKYGSGTEFPVGTPIPVQIRCGIYRYYLGAVSTGLHIDGDCCGTSRAAVEASAF